MHSVSELTNLQGQKVILRLDLNVPLKNGKITDTTRIDKILPTIEFLLKQNSKIIILSHVGRPKGKVIRDLSLKPIQEDIEKKLNEKINLIEKNIYDIRKDILENFNEKILLIENIRFYPEEEKNDKDFAKQLSECADYFVNDAFSVSHRKHVSTYGLSKFLPTYVGRYLEIELRMLEKIFNNFKKISPSVIKVWSKILEETTGKLILKSSMNNRDDLRNNFLSKFPKQLIKNNKITLMEGQKDKKDHLNLYNKIDVALDTFPYNGVTTSMEAIWMGVPVITMAGYNFNSRCGESINKNLGMEQLIAKDENDYVQKIINLSDNHDEYTNLRKFVFTNALKSPLFDNQDYCKNFFEALKEIVK